MEDWEGGMENVARIMERGQTEARPTAPVCQPERMIVESGVLCQEMSCKSCGGLNLSLG